MHIVAAADATTMKLPQDLLVSLLSGIIIDPPENRRYHNSKLTTGYTNQYQAGRFILEQ